MGHFWRVFLVVIVLTLAPMQAAWAECAWVLWNESSWFLVTEKQGVAAPSSSWKIVKLYDDKPRCALAVGLNLSGWASLPSEEPGDDGSKVRRHVEDDRVIITGKHRDGMMSRTERYLCLPDTIDPRGPKGSGR